MTENARRLANIDYRKMSERPNDIIGRTSVNMSLYQSLFREYGGLLWFIVVLRGSITGLVQGKKNKSGDLIRLSHAKISENVKLTFKTYATKYLYGNNINGFSV